MRKALIVIGLGLVFAGAAFADAVYPDVVQVVPLKARAGQTIPNFRIVGTHFENFKSLEFRKSSGKDPLIKVKRIVKKDASSVTAEVELPAGLTGKRVVVVKTAVGASMITATLDNQFEILPAKTSAADLKVSKITWGMFDQGVRIYVENIGGTPVKDFRVGLYIDGAQKPVYSWLSTIPAGSTIPFEPTGLQLPRTKGTYVVKAVADSTGKIPETNESNNTREASFTLPADEITIQPGTYATATTVRDKMAPNFTLKDWRTKPWTLYDNLGKPMLIVIGAMWSKFTQAETAALNKIYSDFAAKGVVVVQVLYDDLDADSSDKTNVDPTPTLIKVWVDANQLTIPVLADTLNSDRSHSAYELYHSYYIPMNYVVKKDGTVYKLIEGFYEQLIREALTAVTQ